MILSPLFDTFRHKKVFNMIFYIFCHIETQLHLRKTDLLGVKSLLQRRY